MVRATLTIQRKKRTQVVEKCYGFAPDAGEKLMDNYSRRLTQAQALAIMGISRTKFRKDRDNGLIPKHGTAEKAWYKGRELYQYWWKQTKGECDGEYVVSGMSDYGKLIEMEKKIKEAARKAVSV